MKKLLAITGVVFLSAVVWAQVGSLVVRPAASNAFQIVPQAVPVTAADLVQRDVYIDEMTFTNTSGSTVTITVQDKQASPQMIFQSTIAASSNYIVDYKGRWAPGGVTWSASGTGVVGYVRGAY